MSHRYRLILILHFCLLGFQSAEAQKTEYSPLISEASDEGQQLLGSFKLPKGMKAELFAAEPMLANPVTFCIDHQGRFYVAETFRHTQGVLDNRSHMDWLHDELSLQTVEERQKMFEKYLGNRLAEYQIQHERIRQISDLNGDGKADRSTVFSDRFGHLMDGIGAGLLSHRGKVYFTCVPKLWSLVDKDNDGVADREEVMFDGFGVRVAFLGHDLHGLCLGPDGRLYFSMGDRGFNVINKEGQRLKKTYTGAVFRCEPDGSKLEVFAYGLRNPQELAFDDFGNLFTGDNNCDSGDKARWVYLMEGSDSGWRMYFQYLSDRGPWNREKMWHLQNKDQPAFIIPPLAHIGSGPSGVVCYPGVGLSERYKDHFFLADFRGNKAISGIRSFGMKQSGAGFEVTDQQEFLWNIVGTDVDFDYKGNLYVLDWTEGWQKPGKGRLYRFFDPAEQKKQKNILNSQQLLNEGLEKRSSEELAKLLRHPDRRIRQEAQFLLADKKSVSILEKVAKEPDHQLARIHAIWGLGQIARQGKGHSKVLVELLKDPDPEIRAQAVRIIGDADIDEGIGQAIQLLGDINRRVRSLAAIAVGRSGRSDAFIPICQLLKENHDQDPYIRHAGMMGLKGISKKRPNLLKLAARSRTDSVRMGAVLVMRREGSAEISQFLQDKEPRIVLEAARSIHGEPINAAMDELARLGHKELKSDPLARRVLYACYRSGTKKDAESVTRIAVNSSLSESVRLEALYELETWNHPEKLDRVDGRWRPIPERKELNPGRFIADALPQLLASTNPIREKTIRLASLYSIKEAIPELLSYAQDSKKSPAIRVEALKGLQHIEYPELKEIVTNVLQGAEKGPKEKAPEVRSECRRILSKIDPENAFAILKETFQKSSTTSEKQESVRILATMNLKEADDLLLDFLTKSMDEKKHNEFLLDLLEVAGSKKNSRFQELVTRYEDSQKTKNSVDQYREMLVGGNRALGHKIFFDRTSASCRRCHKVFNNGAEVGPDLTHVAKDKTREYLVESIVAPNEKISKGFEMITVAMVDGKVINGILKSENDDEMILGIGADYRGSVTLKKEDIEDRTEAKSGMPLDFGKVLSKRDIRDLVEYLSTLK